jgi:hypothetical protein
LHYSLTCNITPGERILSPEGKKDESHQRLPGTLNVKRF